MVGLVRYIAEFLNSLIADDNFNYSQIYHKTIFRTHST